MCIAAIRFEDTTLTIFEDDGTEVGSSNSAFVYDLYYGICRDVLYFGDVRQIASIFSWSECRYNLSTTCVSALPHPVLTVVEPVSGTVEANGTVSLMYMGTGSVVFELCTDYPIEFRVFDYWGNALFDVTLCDGTYSYRQGHCGTYDYVQESAFCLDFGEGPFLWNVTIENTHGFTNRYELEAYDN